MLPRYRQQSQIRQQIAQTAARILLDDPAIEPGHARRKAAQQAGVSNSRHWPSLTEVLEALAQEQRLFCPNQPTVLHQLRVQALSAMQHFANFNPRLVGQVAEGTAGPNHCVCLHLFADTPDEIVLVLLESHIPHEQRQKTLRYAGGVSLPHPVLRFVAGEIDIELIVLPTNARHNPPLNPICERPDRGIDAKQLERLLHIEV